MSVTVTPVRRSRRKLPTQIGNVVPLRPMRETTEDIVASVQARAKQQDEQVLAMLKDLTSSLEGRHRRRARECIPIAMAMSAPGLTDWIEIGRRMLASGSGRR